MNPNNPYPHERAFALQKRVGKEGETFDHSTRATRPVFGPALVQCGNDIFCLYDGRARWVPNEDVLIAHQHFGPPQKVSADVISSSRFGPQLPTKSFPAALAEMTFSQFRQYLCRDLQGVGLEFGAGPRPMEVPALCRMRYADIFSPAEFAEKSTSMRGRSDPTKFVDIDFQDSMDEMATIEESSVDFIIASHVIEHVRSPLRALKKAFDCLKLGGTIILVVPDRNRTFDKNRKITSLDHHLADFYMPSRERDLEHYFEGSRIVEMFTGEALRARAMKRWADRVDTHMHTFTPESFQEIAEWARSQIGYGEYEIYEGALQTPSDEFYVRLHK
ncbi:methyltransferase domain-containing protein [Rhizobiaceae bacterium CRRU44]|uniref:Methyltransferase domain-containing protein n=1 Tax=Ferranicluibacter rubi TaxID=2715133 RepID=A0AA43ZH67_9HYPH|nr:methyltransferase domain-containing protein [Ferranicluibacter rubi]NHT77564.1 methyltransferase domain-containing protein [Ferranicluibacter rubi]